jgi:hypothetical protein
MLDSPSRYRWFPRRFVVMPDHLHLIAHQGHEAARLGQWMKALKAVVGGLERRPDMGRRVGEPGLPGNGVVERPVGAPGLQGAVGRVPSRGAGGDIVSEAGSGYPAYNNAREDVGRVSSPGVPP